MTEPQRRRLRRRLALLSAPVVVVALAAAAVLIATVLAGRSAHRHAADGDTAGLRADVAVLEAVGFLDPATTTHAVGSLAVLEGRLSDAEAAFAEAVAAAGAARSCPARVDLELVRERLADIDAWEGRPDAARGRYRGALTVINEAPAGCFAGNDDPDTTRRAIRADAVERVTAKLRTVGPVAPPPPPPPPPVVGAPPPVPAPTGDQASDVRTLEPRRGDPPEVLQRLLEDAAATP